MARSRATTPHPGDADTSGTQSHPQGWEYVPAPMVTLGKDRSEEGVRTGVGPDVKTDVGTDVSTDVRRAVREKQSAGDGRNPGRLLGGGESLP